MDTKIRHLNIEVTKKCNQRCFYCFNDSGIGSQATELSYERWLDILHELQQQGLQSIHLTGGEPFVYKNAVKLLAGAQAIGLSTSILSNGFRLEELTKTFPDVFRRLTVAQISLDSMNEDAHNIRRGYARAWQDAITAIRALRLLDVPVEVSCVVSDTNLADVGAVAGFCRSVGAALLIRPIIQNGRAANQQIDEFFVRNLAICVQSLTECKHVALVSDRFDYVVDQREVRQTQSQEGIHTVCHDGRLRGSDNDEISLALLAA